MLADTAPAERAHEALDARLRRELAGLDEPEAALAPALPAFTGELIGNDDRTRVHDSLATPYRFVCSVHVDGPGGGPGAPANFGKGTGILIGPRHVLTAAHVLVNSNDRSTRAPRRIEVSPGRNGLGPRGVHLGTHATRNFIVHPLWMNENRARLDRFRLRLIREFFNAFPNFDQRRFQRLVNVTRASFDIGMVVVNNDLSAMRHRRFGVTNGRPDPLGFWGQAAGTRFGRLPPAALANRLALVAGYPFDRQRRQHAQGWDLFEGPGQLQAPHLWSRMLQHTADTESGNSGGPVWVDDGGAAVLVGIHQGEGTRGDGLNRAVRVTREVVRTVRAWRARR